MGDSGLETVSVMYSSCVRMRIRASRSTIAYQSMAFGESGQRVHHGGQV